MQENPFNIFDEATRRLNQQKKSKPMPPSSSVKSEQRATPSNEETERLFSKIQSMHDDINRKLEEMYQKAGWTADSVKDYLNNPNNFNSTDWQHIQDQRKQLLGKVKQAINQGQEEKIDKDKIGKERRAKTLGARKNWLPMR
jgi:uncharacterized protein YoxC